MDRKEVDNIINWIKDFNGRLFYTLKYFKRYQEFDKFITNILEAQQLVYDLKNYWFKDDRNKELISEYINRLNNAIDTALDYKPFKDDDNEHQDISVK